MLTISISESLNHSAIDASNWSEWATPDAAWTESAGFANEEAITAQEVIAAECWHQQMANAQWGSYEAEDPSWSLFSGSPTWPTPEMAAIHDQQAASLALASTAIPEAGHDVPALGEAAKGKAMPNEAAFASPLRVPLPEPLNTQPLSELELGTEFELLELPGDSPTTEPQKILSSPPGLFGISETSPAAASAPAPVQKPSVPVAMAAASQNAPQGITICSAEVGGQPCTRVEWKIDDFSGKLQASMGRPVVSPAFDACGLSNLRLMVFPDARDTVKSARSHERKSLYANMVKKGPLYGSLKLKADGLEMPTVMVFSLVVGNVRCGPNTYDFSEQAVCGLDDFGVDWLQQVDKPSGALRASIEIFNVRPKV
jgi:hypothetical protein